MVEPDDVTQEELAKGYKKGHSYTLTVQVDIETLIENVFVSPYANDWFKELVEKEMKLNGLEKPVVYSKMNEQALFFFSRRQLRQMWKSTLEGKNLNK